MSNFVPVNLAPVKLALFKFDPLKFVKESQKVASSLFENCIHILGHTKRKTNSNASSQVKGVKKATHILMNINMTLLEELNEYK